MRSHHLQSLKYSREFGQLFMICLLSESNLSELESGLNINPQRSSFVAAYEAKLVTTLCWMGR